MKIDLHSQNFCIYYTYPIGIKTYLFIYCILYDTHKRSKEKTAYSFQKGKKFIGQNNNYGRKE